MSRRCEICGKGTQVGMQRSRSQVRTKRRVQPNLQRTRVTIDGKQRRIVACTRCLRTLRKAQGVF